MAKRKLQKKSRAVKTVETYATAPTCTTCVTICDMTSADVRAKTQVDIFIYMGGPN